MLKIDFVKQFINITTMFAHPPCVYPKTIENKDNSTKLNNGSFLNKLKLQLVKVEVKKQNAETKE